MGYYRVSVAIKVSGEADKDLHLLDYSRGTITAELTAGDTFLVPGDSLEAALRKVAPAIREALASVFDADACNP